MKRIPHARGVAQAIRATRAAAQKSLKGLNQVASQRMAKGDYATAERLAGKGKEIRQFQLEIAALSKRWNALSSGRERSHKNLIMPLWSYYQPILQALVQLGGECRRIALEGQLEKSMDRLLQAGDREPMARGRERWRVMVQRARKPLVSEGWIEDRSGPAWRITDTGRRTAERPVGRDSLARARASEGER